MSSPMKLTSSASFSPSIRISLRLRIHQAQAKNFCHVLDIRVAESVYVSQWHLSKLIGKYTSQSFSELLNGVRIAKAKELLQDPSLRIWEISERVGFTDVTHFSRIFKKMENRSANEYRNQVLGGGGR